MLPSSNDALILRVAFGKRKGCFKARNDRLEEFQLAVKDVADKFRNSEGAYQIVSYGEPSFLWLQQKLHFPDEIVP